LLILILILTAKDTLHIHMSTRKEYGVDKRAQAAAQFYVGCNMNPNTKLKIPAAMRAKGYSDDDAADRTLQAQVRRRRAAERLRQSKPPPPYIRNRNTTCSCPNVYATSTRSNVPPARATISALVVNVDLGALPSPEKKTRRTSHQVQMERENKKKRASVNDLATSRTTTLSSEGRKKPQRLRE